MKALQFLPALLLVLGAGSASPADAQELNVKLGSEHGQVDLAFSKIGVRASVSSSGRGRSRGHGYERGRGYGREIRVDYRNQRHVCTTSRIWVPGHYENREHQVFVPGHREKVWIEPAYETFIDECGRRSRRIVRNGYWDVIEHPGYYETRCERVFVPGHFERRSCCSR